MSTAFVLVAAGRRENARVEVPPFRLVMGLNGKTYRVGMVRKSVE
ncbi:hypothetical protein [Pseudoclavibacter albus]|nr:hypothetical protein [Pseudoclavibacter alba]